MQTITTQDLDNYVQTICADRSLTPAERATSAATAIHVHVMQEAGLPIGTQLPVEEMGVQAREGLLEAHAEGHMNALMDTSLAAWEALEAAHPEGPAKMVPGVLHIPSEVSLDKENWPRDLQLVVTESAEGNGESYGPTRVWGEDGPEVQEKFNRWYNDDKDEQQ